MVIPSISSGRNISKLIWLY